MNQKELKELIEFLKEQDIAEFELERGDVKVRIKRAIPNASAPHDVRFVPVPAAPPPAPLPAHAPVTPATHSSPAPAKEAPAEALEEGLHMVRSPIVGTFYEAPSPGAPPFVKVGDSVEVGQVLCIVEAMKLMNEIESKISGRIHKILVENGQAVEYGQPLFLLAP